MGVRLFYCRKLVVMLLHKVSTITVKNIYLVNYCSLYAFRKDKMNTCSDSNVKTTPYKCCMYSSDMVIFSTDVMSDVCNASS